MMAAYGRNMKWKNGKHPGSVPCSITPQVRAFAVEHGGEPIYVDLDPLPYAEYKQCYGNCDLACQMFGGRMVLGYSIWTTRGLFLSSEHHCVWRTPCGDLQDVTPDVSHAKRILFVPVREIECADAAQVVDEVILNGNNGQFRTLVKSELIEKAMETLDKASSRLHRLSNEAIRTGRALPDSEEERFDHAMDDVDHLIDCYYRTIRRQRENEERKKRRKARKIAKAKKRWRRA